MMFRVPSFSEFQRSVDTKSKELVVWTEKYCKRFVSEARCQTVADHIAAKPGYDLLFRYIVSSTMNPVRTPSELLYRDQLIG